MEEGCLFNWGPHQAVLKVNPSSVLGDHEGKGVKPSLMWAWSLLQFAVSV